MGDKIKRFLLSFNRLNKPAVLAAGLFFIILGIIVPLHFAEASWFLNLFYKFIDAIFAAVFQILMAITWVPLVIANQLLLWVIGPNFITVPFTNNDIVNLGWDLVRDFVNIFFILVLAFIGLATALRIPGYEYKKALPLLIAVALLINFTPVICGLIIDASNIVMNFFLGSTGSALNSFAGKFISQTKFLWETVGRGANPGVLIAQGILLVMFNVVVAFVFGCFTILFFCRYAILWLLVILSPLAFFCYILPATRKVWSMWWNQFIQWCMIGITGAFFLYLGEQMIALQEKILKSQPTLPPDLSGFAGIVTSALPLIFLIVGFLMSLQTGAMGGSAIIGFAKKATGKGMRAYYGAIGRRVRVVVPKRVKERAARWAVAPGFGAGVPGVRGALMRGVAAPVTWAKRRIGRGVVRVSIADRRRAIEQAVAEGEKEVIPEIGASKALEALQIREIDKATGLYYAAVKKGGGYFKKFKESFTPEQIEKFTKNVNDLGDEEKAKDMLYGLAQTEVKDAKGNIVEDFNTVAERVGFTKDKMTEDDRLNYENYGQKLLAEVKPDDVGKLSKGFWKTEAAEEAMHKFWTGTQVGEAARKFGKPFIDAFQEQAKEKGEEYYAAINPALHKYLDSSAAKGLGFALPEKLTKTPEAREAKINEFKQKEADQRFSRLMDLRYEEYEKIAAENVKADMKRAWARLSRKEKIAEAWRIGKEGEAKYLKIFPGLIPAAALGIGRAKHWAGLKADDLSKGFWGIMEKAEKRQEAEIQYWWHHLHYNPEKPIPYQPFRWVPMPPTGWRPTWSEEEFRAKERERALRRRLARTAERVPPAARRVIMPPRRAAERVLWGPPEEGPPGAPTP